MKFKKIVGAIMILASIMPLFWGVIALGELLSEGHITPTNLVFLSVGIIFLLQGIINIRQK